MKIPLRVRKAVQHPDMILPFLLDQFGPREEECDFDSLDTDEVLVEIDDLEMYVRTDDTGPSRQIYCHNEYESGLTNVVQEFVGEGDTAVDIGAHIGYITLQMARQVGDSGNVLSFEPEPVNYRFLDRNVRANGFENRVECHNTALGEDSGETTLRVDADNKGASNVVSKSDTERDETVTVPISTPDGHLDSDIDFVKLDIEGWEPVVMDSLEELLAESTPVLTFEYLPHLWDDTPEATIQMLQRCGYEFYNVSEYASNNRFQVDSRKLIENPDEQNAEILCLPRDR